VISVRIFAAISGSPNAGTVTSSRPTYSEELVTSPSTPPELDQAEPFRSGSERTGARPPQIKR
jgi:hypothetical protein